MREKCHDWAPMQEDPSVLPSIQPRTVCVLTVLPNFQRRPYYAHFRPLRQRGTATTTVGPVGVSRTRVSAVYMTPC